MAPNTFQAYRKLQKRRRDLHAFAQNHVIKDDLLYEVKVLTDGRTGAETTCYLFVVLDKDEITTIKEVHESNGHAGGGKTWLQVGVMS